tara:strand:- start:949 stop:1149 length:201 start_codon:yes stop_codon:yes gene_type:complete
MKYVITYRYYETYNEKLIVKAKDIDEVKEIYNKMYQSKDLDDVKGNFLEDSRIDRVQDIEIEKCQP